MNIRSNTRRQKTGRGFRKILLAAAAIAALSAVAAQPAAAAGLGNNIVTSGISQNGPGNVQTAGINATVIANNVTDGSVSMTSENVEQLASGALDQTVGNTLLPAVGNNTGTLGITQVLTSAQSQVAGATVLVSSNTLNNVQTSGLAANVSQLGTFTGTQGN